MQITIIHGQSHKGSTYHITRILAEKIGDSVLGERGRGRNDLCGYE